MGPKERKTNLVQGRDPVLEDHSLVEEIQKAEGTEGTGQVTVCRQLRCRGSSTWMSLCPCRQVQLAGWLQSFLFLLRRVGFFWESASEVQLLKVVGYRGQAPPPAATTSQPS